MKNVFLLLMFLVPPSMGFAGGDSGWAERGNGKEFLPPECQQGVVEPRKPLRPVTESDLINGDHLPGSSSCSINQNIIGSGQPKINN